MKTFPETLYITEGIGYADSPPFEGHAEWENAEGDKVAVYQLVKVCTVRSTLTLEEDTQ